MVTLGIETTCDESAAAIVKDGKEILSNIVYSQEEHKQFGGVFPELASRRHAELIIPVIDRAITSAGIRPKEIALIGVARGPGLMGSLLVGITAAKALSLAWKIPFIGVNHVEAHLFAPMMTAPNDKKSIGVVLSGGHTFLVAIEGGSYRLLGTTVDDAIGEAFDKVATILGLGYPGGAKLEKLALQGDPNAVSFPSGKVKGSPLNFSFSGLKTSVLYRKNEASPADIAASFQKSAFLDVIEKTLLAATIEGTNRVFLGGGVCQNSRLQEMFTLKAPHLELFFAPPYLCTDNGAMIAAYAFYKYHEGDTFDLEAMPRMGYTIH